MIRDILKTAWRLICTPVDPDIKFGRMYDARRHPDIDRIDTDVRDAFAEATALDRAGADMRRALSRFDAEDADLKCWKICERLRADEGDSVTLLCDNPDGEPNNAVECCGFWTCFETRRFEGDTILAALTLAVATYEEQRAKP